MLLLLNYFKYSVLLLHYFLYIKWMNTVFSSLYISLSCLCYVVFLFISFFYFHLFFVHFFFLKMRLNAEFHDKESKFMQMTVNTTCATSEVCLSYSLGLRRSLTPVNLRALVCNTQSRCNRVCHTLHNRNTDYCSRHSCFELVITCTIFISFLLLLFLCLLH